MIRWAKFGWAVVREILSLAVPKREPKSRPVNELPHATAQIRAASKCDECGTRYCACPRRGEPLQ
jgi:hypothetical protein